MKNQKKSTFAQYCKEHLPVQQKTEMIANLKRNWYFPISAMAFFLITIDDSLGYCLGLPIAFGAMIVIASQIHSVWDAVNRYTFWNKILCFACAVGICLGNQAHFYGRVEKLIVKIDLPEVLYKVFLPVSYIGAACATFFVFFLCTDFLQRNETNICGSW